MRTHYDTIVVGAGAMGSAAAWWLARRGRQVLLTEQFEQGHTRGSSHGGSRILRLAYPDPAYVLLVAEALVLWRELEAEAGEPLVDIVGNIDHGDPEAVDAIAGALIAAGVPFERLDPVAAAERWPNMSFDRAVVHQPDGGRCRADAAVAALQARAVAHGAEARFGVGPVTVTVVGGAVQVVVAGEACTARTAVVTAGGWLPDVLGAAVTLPALEVTEEQIVHFRPRPGAQEGPAAWPSFIHHSERFYYGLVTPGQGIKVGGHHEGVVVHPDRRTHRLDPAYAEGLSRYAQRWLPGVTPEPLAGATCLYTSTKDSRFLIDRAGPLVVASACSGHGFKFTPLIGRLLADLVDGVAPSGPFRRLTDAA